MSLTEKSTFRSKWFPGIVTVIKVKEQDNILLVEIDPDVEGRSKWTEEWNLSHTYVGLKHGDYFHLTQPKQ